MSGLADDNKNWNVLQRDKVLREAGKEIVLCEIVLSSILVLERRVGNGAVRICGSRGFVVVTGLTQLQSQRRLVDVIKKRVKIKDNQIEISRPTS